MSTRYNPVLEAAEVLFIAASARLMTGSLRSCMGIPYVIDRLMAPTALVSGGISHTSEFPNQQDRLKDELTASIYS